jgi:peptidyl-prolyl cis-trans isomerase SurA
MKYSQLKYFLFILFFLNFFSSLFAINNKIIAKIDNEVITSFELKNKILTTLFLSNEIVTQSNVNKSKALVMNTLTNLKLKKNELNRYGIDYNKLDVSNQLKSISSNNIKELKNKFNQNNLNYEKFVEDLKIEIGWRQLIFNLYSEKIKLDETEINKQISIMRKSEKQVIEFRLSEVLINFESQKDKNDKINFIKKQFEEIGFENTALKFSESSTSIEKGDLGWLNSKGLSNQILSVVSEMDTGEISKPIVSSNFILFLKLNNKRKGEIQKENYEVIKKRLIEQKKNELFSLYSKSYLSKIKNNSFIEYK